MKNYGLLLVLGILTSSYSFAKKSTNYLYIDGNNNTYEISPDSLNYIPVQKENSSSGVYSGGLPKKVNLSENQFLEIEKMIRSILKEKQYLADSREMGFGTIKIGNKAKFIHRDSPLLQNLNSYLKSILA